MVSAFSIGWSDHASGVVDIKWKKAAADQNWRGADLKEHSAGFVLMSSPPTEKLEQVLADRRPMPRKYLNDLTGNKMKGAVEAHAPPGESQLVMQWLLTSATTGMMPFERVAREDSVQSADIRGTWGAKIKIGVGSKKGDFFLLEPGEELASCEKFWELPSPTTLQQLQDQETARTVVGELLTLPQIRLKGAPKPSPVAGAPEMRHVGVFNALNNSDPAVSQVMDNLEPILMPSSPASGSEAKAAEKQIWGADYRECKVGHFAVVDVEFEDKRGIEVVKISKIVHQDDEQEQAEFEAVPYLLNSRNLNQADAACLTANWYKPGRSTDRSKFMSWWVLAYTPTLTAAGKLPAITRRTITDKIKDQSTGTFQPIQRSNAASDGNDDDPDSASDSEWIASDEDSQPRRGKRPRTN